MAKPSKHLDWGINPPVGGIVEPGQAKKEFGWVADERPPAQFWNYNLNLIDQWLKYLDEEIGTAVASWDAIVGNTATFPEATHDTLEDVMNDGSIPNGSRILVIEDYTVDTTIVINKAYLEIYFKPLVTYSKGTATTGLQISAEGVKVINGIFDGWTTGGDTVFTMLGTAAYCWFERCQFENGAGTEIDDASTNPGQKPRISTYTRT